MKAEVISAATAALYMGIGLSSVLNPFWWRSPLRNPFSPHAFSLSGDAARSYRLDFLSQSLRRGQPAAHHRDRWTREAHHLAQGMPPGGVQPVPEYDWKAGSADDFYRRYAVHNRPVVLRGFLRAHTDLERWRFARLLQDFGDETVRLACPVRADYPGKLSELQVPGVYLHNAEVLTARHPELVRELGMPGIARALRGPMQFAGAIQFFVGRKQTGSSWHCAPSQNFFLMLEGRKRWSFIDAAYSPLMSPTHAGRNNVFWSSGVTRGSRVFAERLALMSPSDQLRIQRQEETPQRRASAEMFSKCPRLEVTLEPGDLLFIAPWWWHEVENRSETSVAVATRWFDPTAKQSPNPDLEALLMLRPKPAYTSSLLAFSESLLTRQGELRDTARRARPRTIEANTRDVDIADIREGVEAYYARCAAGRA